MKKSKTTILFILLSFTLTVPAAAEKIADPAPDPVPLPEPKPELGEIIPGEYVISFTDGTDPAKDEAIDAESEAKRLIATYGGRQMFVYNTGFKGVALSGLTTAQADEIAADPMVKAIEENRYVTTATAGTQTPVPSWGIDRIDQRMLLTNNMYMYDHMGTGVTAYVIDTGILASHPDFGGRVRWLADCTGQGTVDNHGHGTGMAGIIGGKQHGVAKNVNLVAVKVIGANGFGTLAQVICGQVVTIFDVLINNTQPAVVNMGLIGRPSFILDLVTNISIRFFGLQYVVPAGNFTQSACNFSPARVPAALTVAASDQDTVNVQDFKATFSNFGSCVDLFAPGVAITTTWNNGGSVTVSGTSAANAHATGVAAAWLEANPALSPSALVGQIVTTATAGKISNPMGSPNLLLYKKQVQSPSIDVAASSQRVHDFLILRGSGFGTFQPGSSQVLFFDNSVTIPADTPYVWRNDYIQVRVPTGDLIAGTATPIPTTPLNIAVVQPGDRSNHLPFQVITAGGTLSFQELTQIVGNQDVSTVLGNPNMNLRRTKDGEVGDVDGDGFPDLVDNNSVNIRNQHHSVVRLNNGNKTFSAFELEPFDAGDVGVYLTTVPPGGTFIEDGTTYDSDLVDLNNDGFPDLVEALRNHGAQPSPCPANPTTQLVRVLLNNNGAPGLFLEDSVNWLGSTTFPGPADDVDHTDVDYDGFVDVAIAYRFSSMADILVNSSGTGFVLPTTRLTSTVSPVSIHDVFFLDANHDFFQDVILVNESSNSQLFVHNGASPPGFTASTAFAGSRAFAGTSADFNADGLADFAVVRSSVATVFLNNPASPGTFTTVSLPNPPPLGYDIEAGDVDLDGDVDLIAVAITTSAANTVRVWLNNGSGTVFADVTASVLTTLAPYQRLSADLLDLDLDGDLDLYITGADGQDVGPPTGCVPGPFGRVPNQLFENVLIP
ncbi:MAG: hypothetical protein D6696_03855 [Acidobacteria bacterium]|nr:MAG: hypothetical protein D6696_03855 [Acidobacteriota bacterium]